MKSRLLIALLLAPLGAQAQTLKSGEQVYKETCSLCHGMKVEKSPQLGDRAAWAPLIKEGQVTLSGDAWLGVRNMPPRGGSTTLSLEEFARGVAYMARAAGAAWQDPDRETMEKIVAAVKRAEQKRSKK